MSTTRTDHNQIFDRNGNLLSEEVVEVEIPFDPENVTSFINALIGYFGIDRAEGLMRDYPTYIRALDGANWEIAQNRMNKMLSDESVTQEEYEYVQGLWDHFNLPRPDVDF